MLEYQRLLDLPRKLYTLRVAWSKSCYQDSYQPSPTDIGVNTWRKTRVRDGHGPSYSFIRNFSTTKPDTKAFPISNQEIHTSAQHRTEAECEVGSFNLPPTPRRAILPHGSNQENRALRQS